LVQGHLFRHRRLDLRCLGQPNVKAVTRSRVSR
jgi:hypothetical protein